VGDLVAGEQAEDQPCTDRGQQPGADADTFGQVLGQAEQEGRANGQATEPPDPFVPVRQVDAPDDKARQQGQTAHTRGWGGVQLLHTGMAVKGKMPMHTLRCDDRQSSKHAGKQRNKEGSRHEQILKRGQP
jgi:hypothetical protein